MKERKKIKKLSRNRKGKGAGEPGEEVMLVGFFVFLCRFTLSGGWIVMGKNWKSRCNISVDTIVGKGVVEPGVEGSGNEASNEKVSAPTRQTQPWIFASFHRFLLKIQMVWKNWFRRLGRTKDPNSPLLAAALQWQQLRTAEAWLCFKGRQRVPRMITFLKIDEPSRIIQTHKKSGNISKEDTLQKRTHPIQAQREGSCLWWLARTYTAWCLCFALGLKLPSVSAGTSSPRVGLGLHRCTAIILW